MEKVLKPLMAATWKQEAIMSDVHTHSLFQAWHYLQTGNNKKKKGEVRLNQRQGTQCSFILYAVP